MVDEIDEIHSGKQPHYYIREHVAASPLNDTQIALRMGLQSRKAISDYKRYPHKLKPQVLAALCEALYGHTSYLVFTRLPGAKPRPSLDAEAQGLDDEDFNRVLDMARRFKAQAS